MKWTSSQGDIHSLMILKVWKWSSLTGFYEPLTKHVFCQVCQPDTEFPRQDRGGQEGAETFIALWRQEEKLQKLARNAWPAICSSVCSEIFSVALWPGLIFLIEALSNSGCAYLTVSIFPTSENTQASEWCHCWVLKVMGPEASPCLHLLASASRQLSKILSQIQ